MSAVLTLIGILFCIILSLVLITVATKTTQTLVDYLIDISPDTQQEMSDLKKLIDARNELIFEIKDGGHDTKKIKILKKERKNLDSSINEKYSELTRVAQKKIDKYISGPG